MEEIVAVSEARALLKRLGVDSVPVDVAAIAAELGFSIKTSDDMAVGESGQLFTLGSQKYILVNGNDSPFRQRFTVLHEIAHEVLQLPSVHGDAVSATALESYSSRPREEVLCDVFAAECLVPWRALAPMTEEHPYDVDTIEHLSDVFQASRPCVASRFVQASRGLNAYVLAEKGIVRYVNRSLPVRELGYWIPIGVQIPSNSAAAVARRAKSTSYEASVDGTTWSASNCAVDVDCDEAAIWLEPWDQTLSLLTLENLNRRRGDNRRSGEDESELLSELTGQLPWPRR